MKKRPCRLQHQRKKLGKISEKGGGREVYEKCLKLNLNFK